jgi:hypothetical protein
MPLSDLQRVMVEIDARADATHLIVRALVQRLALSSPDARAYAVDLFSGLSAFLDRVDEVPAEGEYVEARRAASRRYIDDLAAEMARDIPRR